MKATKEDLAERDWQLGKVEVHPETGKTKAESRKETREALKAHNAAIEERSKKYKQPEKEVEPQNIADDSILDGNLKVIPDPLTELLSNNRETLDTMATHIAETKAIELPKFANKTEVAQWVLDNQ